MEVTGTRITAGAQVLRLDGLITTTPSPGSVPEPYSEVPAHKYLPVGTNLGRYRLQWGGNLSGNLFHRSPARPDDSLAAPPRNSAGCDFIAESPAVTDRKPPGGGWPPAVHGDEHGCPITSANTFISHREKKKVPRPRTIHCDTPLVPPCWPPVRPVQRSTFSSDKASPVLGMP